MHLPTPTHSYITCTSPLSSPPPPSYHTLTTILHHLYSTLPFYPHPPLLFCRYNITGRGYPDIAVSALDYVTVVGGNLYLLSGTSAAAPVVAGMLALVNARRLAGGYPTLGHINPLLYKLFNKAVNSSSSGSGSGSVDTPFNDVTKGGLLSYL